MQLLRYHRVTYFNMVGGKCVKMDGVGYGGTDVVISFVGVDLP